MNRIDYITFAPSAYHDGYLVVIGSKHSPRARSYWTRYHWAARLCTLISEPGSGFHVTVSPVGWQAYRKGAA